MYATDFEYDGRLLSNFGYIICQFGEGGGLETRETGFTISFNKVPRRGGRINGLVSTRYENCATCTFQICKNPDDHEDIEITNDEYRDLVRWLNRHEFLRFRIISEAEGLDRAQCYFNASFNVSKIYVSDVLVGLELTAETDAPFGYGELYVNEWTVEAGASIKLTDLSDETSFIRPDITIRCLSSGDLVVSNETMNSTMCIRNCSAGEVINIYGGTQIITTSIQSHKIYNDFNFEFLKIGNTYNNRKNVISFSLPCKVKISYAPIVKDIP